MRACWSTQIDIVPRWKSFEILWCVFLARQICLENMRYCWLTFSKEKRKTQGEICIADHSWTKKASQKSQLWLSQLSASPMTQRKKKYCVAWLPFSEVSSFFFQLPVFWSRSNSQAETTVDIPEPEVLSIPPSPLFKLPPYTPPDALMFPLISAIERKAWLQARQLARELLVYDIDRPSYRELFARLNQIINLIDRRLRPRSVSRETSTANTRYTGRSSPKRPL